MFQLPPPSMGPMPIRKRTHQHHESKKWIRLPTGQKCLECYPIPKPFLDTAFGKIPPEIREKIFKDVLTVGSISPLKDGISVPMVKIDQKTSESGLETKLSIGPVKAASCLALLQTCRQIYHESSLLFYAVNTFYLSDPQKMLSFLCHLGPLRCDELRSFHIEEMLVSTPLFSQRFIDRLRPQGLLSENEPATTVTGLEDRIHPYAEKAMQLLNRRGNIQKINLDMRPSQTLEYIRLCTKIPGFKNRGVVFASPTRWSVMAPSSTWEKSWFHAFVEHDVKEKFHSRDYLAYYEEYRVEVDIVQVRPKEGSARAGYKRSVDGGNGEGSSVDTAMEILSLS